MSVVLARPESPPPTAGRGREEAALEVIRWADARFGRGLVLGTSFGIQSAVMLDLATRIRPDIPVVWVDTGYLPAETYRFAEALTGRLGLNLKVYQSPLSPARMEATMGRLWASDAVADLDLYDRIRKVEPMARALRELEATAWLAGLRRDQTDHRARLPMTGPARIAEDEPERTKILPILEWSSKDIYDYLKGRDLPYHPLWEAGYVTVGDAHSSRPLGFEGEDARATRFRGRKQECGLHLSLSEDAFESLDGAKL